MEATLATISPYLRKPLSPAQEETASSWLLALSALVTARYGARLDKYKARTGNDLLPVVYVYMAAAIERRFAKKVSDIESEGAGPFRVQWNGASSLAAWFRDEELAELDGALGLRGSRTYRTPAPDAIRFRNLSDTEVDTDDLALTMTARDAAGTEDV